MTLAELKKAADKAAQASIAAAEALEAASLAVSKATLEAASAAEAKAAEPKNAKLQKAAEAAEAAEAKAIGEMEAAEAASIKLYSFFKVTQFAASAASADEAAKKAAEAAEAASIVALEANAYFNDALKSIEPLGGSMGLFELGSNIAGPFFQRLTEKAQPQPKAVSKQSTGNGNKLTDPRKSRPDTDMAKVHNFIFGLQGTYERAIVDPELTNLIKGSSTVDMYLSKLRSCWSEHGIGTIEFNKSTVTVDTLPEL